MRDISRQLELHIITTRTHDAATSCRSLLEPWHQLGIFNLREGFARIDDLIYLVLDDEDDLNA